MDSINAAVQREKRRETAVPEEDGHEAQKLVTTTTDNTG